MDPRKDVDPAHARHGVVEQHQADAVAVPVEQIEADCPSLAVIASNPSRARMAATRLRIRFLVVHHQHRALGHALGKGGSRGLGIVGGAAHRGEDDPEQRALPGSAAHRDRPPVGLDDPQHGGQTEPPARLLGGEERIEDASFGLGVQAGPGVGDLQPGVVARVEMRSPEELTSSSEASIDSPVATRMVPPLEATASAALVMRLRMA